MWCLKRNFFFCVIFLSIGINYGFNFDWTCDSDNDCTTPKSKCNKNICKCESGYVFSSDMTSCLKAVTSYGESCDDTVQCSAFLFAGGSCKIEKSIGNVVNSTDASCVCQEGYHYLHGRCYRSSGLGERCRSNDDCFVNADFEATSCKNKICVCSDGFYQREYRTCRRFADAIGEDCVIDNDCRFFKNATCPNFICQLKINSISLLHETENFNEEENRISELGNACTNDNECDISKNMTCGPESKCICLRAFFNSSGICIQELGEPCSTSEIPKIKDSVCRNDRWSCKTGKVASTNNQICRKVTKAYMKSCLYDEQCYVFGPDAVCNEKKCICKNSTHYVKEDMFCWMNKGIGEQCLDDKDCHIHGAEFKLSCENSICSCPDGTLPNSENTACVKIPTGINAPCKKTEDCILENGDCISNICTCKENYVPLSEDNCIKISSHGKLCEYDIQCNASLTNGICFKSHAWKNEGLKYSRRLGICNCAYGYHYKNGNCFEKRVLGEKCQNESQCYLDDNIERVKCRNAICSCDLGYHEWDATTCQKNGSTAIYLPIWIGLMAAAFDLLFL